MGVLKVDPRNHLFYYLEEIILRSFSDFSGSQGCSGMGEEQRAQAFLYPCLLDHRIDACGHIHDFFSTPGRESQRFRHIAPLCMNKGDRLLLLVHAWPPVQDAGDE